jgi:hypothetical protein
MLNGTHFEIIDFGMYMMLLIGMKIHKITRVMEFKNLKIKIYNANNN